jgi:hypothetical protein
VGRRPNFQRSPKNHFHHHQTRERHTPMKNSSFKVGQSVVYKRANGDTVSGKITGVAPNAVVVSWAVAPGKARGESVQRASWGNITAFGNAMFLSIS